MSEVRTLDIFIHQDRKNPESFNLKGYDGSAYGDILIEQRLIEFNVPDLAVRVQTSIAAMREKISVIQAEAYAEVKEFEECIQKLLSIEYNPEDERESF